MYAIFPKNLKTMAYFFLCGVPRQAFGALIITIKEKYGTFRDRPHPEPDSHHLRSHTQDSTAMDIRPFKAQKRPHRTITPAPKWANYAAALA